MSLPKMHWLPKEQWGTPRAGAGSEELSGKAPLAGLFSGEALPMQRLMEARQCSSRCKARPPLLPRLTQYCTPQVFGPAPACCQTEMAQIQCLSLHQSQQAAQCSQLSWHARWSSSTILLRPASHRLPQSCQMGLHRQGCRV